MPDKIKVKVFRYNPANDIKPRYDTFEVPASENTSILTILKYIKSKHDSTLAFRDYICYKGICANCIVRFNGKIVKSCSTRIEPGQSIMIEPVANHPIIRDLVVDFGSSFKGEEASYLIRKGVMIDIIKKE